MKVEIRGKRKQNRWEGRKERGRKRRKEGRSGEREGIKQCKKVSKTKSWEGKEDKQWRGDGKEGVQIKRCGREKVGKQKVGKKGAMKAGEEVKHGERKAGRNKERGKIREKEGAEGNKKGENGFRTVDKECMKEGI